MLYITRILALIVETLTLNLANLYANNSVLRIGD